MSHANEQEEAVNADSFLDIVASVVSVMIIMVMMTGLKIKNTPVDAAPTAAIAQANGDLSRETAREKTLREEVLKVSKEVGEVRKQAAVRQKDRDILALAVNSLDGQLRGARQAADTAARQDGQLAPRLTDARSRLEALNRQIDAVDNAPAETVQIESQTTPIARTVDGRELHFQLRRGRIAYVPLNELVEKASADLKRKAYKLGERPELTDSVPPEQGFRLTYTVRLRPPTPEELRESGRRGPRIEDRVVLTPLSDDLGEPIDVALRPESQFHLTLADRRAKDATVTLWIYPECFDDFRRVKKDLYARGFSVASRPLPEGVPISGSSQGTKSTAE